MVARIVQGDLRHRTRLHDFEGNLVDGGGLAYLPAAAISALLKRWGVYPERPWLGYRAARRLAALLTPTSRVLEFGSGASTRWLAARAGEVVSIESDPAWAREVARSLEVRGIANVDLRLRTEPESYVAVEGQAEGSFDLVLVDGAWRDRAAAKAVRAVRPGGAIYFDNSDVPDPDHREAKRLLLAAFPGARSETFLDFAPLEICVTQGLLVFRPDEPRA